tara:strand:+ start:233 stop:808 length:576 start_codon:yes stop_codon:yes gene_type:complete
MSRTIHTTKEPVVLEGFQAVLRPSQYGYSLKAVVDKKLIDDLEEERVEALKWAESKLKKPANRCVLRPEPWEEVAKGKYIVKFSWNEEKKPPVVDTEGTPITDSNTPVYEGSLVKLGFVQKPYLLKDGVTYGTSLKLAGLQIVSLNSGAGVDSGDLDQASVSELFGTCNGYKANDPNVTITPTSPTEDDDF